MQVTAGAGRGMGAASAAALELEVNFLDLLRGLGPFSSKPHLAIALSGGADSLALTLLTHQWTHACGGRVTALTVDHGLRAESVQEARDVQQQMQSRGIAHHILTPLPSDASNNLQESARTRRYDALAEWCRLHDVLHCLIAHHAGDQRETVAHNQQRGDTADGDAGMACVRTYRGIRFLRPLLSIEKETLVHYLYHQGESWVEDPSNRNMDFARVRLRGALANEPLLQQSLSTHAFEQGKRRAERDAALAAVALQSVTLHPAGFAEILHAKWLALDGLLGTQLLADVLTTISGATHRPRAKDTERLAEALRGQFKRRTLHGCEISLQHGILRVAREYARVAPTLLLTQSGTSVWDNRFRLSYHLPPPLQLILAPLGAFPKSQHPPGVWPKATPAIGHLDQLLFVPHITPAHAALPDGACVTLGFAPAKPLAAAPFWWLNHGPLPSANR